MPEPTPDRERRTKRTRRRVIWWSVAGVVALLVVCGVWVTVRALQAKSQLEAALPLVDKVQSQITSGDSAAAVATTRTLAQHLHSARDDTSDPIWRAAEILPGIGGNLSAVRQLSFAASDVADRSIAPLAKLAGSINLSSLSITDGTVQLKPLAAAAPTVTRANAALQSDLELVRSIDASGTIGPVREAVQKLRGALTKAGAVTDVASRAAQLLPAMLGADGPRDYLLVFQNNDEARSTGGIVGALALIHTDDGRISLVRQASASDLPPLSKTVLPLSSGTKALYADRPGRYIQDTTMTPDFATTGRLVSAMWKKQYGTSVDGVLSIDPVALGDILKATGPVDVSAGIQLTSDNAVGLLLSQSYSTFTAPAQQDAFFAAAASAVFSKVATGQFDKTAMLSALAQAGDQRRVLIWNANAKQQAVLANTTLAGPLPVSTATESRFGVYLNDATGGKMDYYLHTAVGLGSATCRSDGRANYLVSVTLTSDAPKDAATSLPWYVTGAGLFGVPAGDTYTTIAVYAPKGFVTVGATNNGKSLGIQRATDAGHSVAHVLMKLAPGQSGTYQFQFVAAPVAKGDSAVRTIEAVTTPGVWATKVRPVDFECSSVLS